MTSYSLRKTDFRKLISEHPDAVAAIICAVLLILGWLCLLFNWIGLALLILSAAYVIGGYESAKEGLTTLFAEKEFDVDLLMIVAALGAAFLGLWRGEYHLIVDGAVLILIFAISGALEGYAMQRTNNAISSLMGLTPDTARVILHGEEKQVAIDKLAIDDKLLVKPGELIPTDALIIEGASNLNEASITGESLPVEKTVGDEVFAGTINGTGALIIRVHQPPESSLIQRVIRLVQQAQTEAPPSQIFVENLERNYAKVIVVCGILLATLPPFIFNWDWETTIYKALIFLVVASPCALMAAIMPALLSGIANGARGGILFKGGAVLELVGKVKAIAFDKTGTLTTGEPQVMEVIAVDGEDVNQVLSVAAAVEVYSEHPIGKAIVQAAQNKNLALVSANNVVSHTGFGISGNLKTQTQIKVGNANFIQSDSQLPANLVAISKNLETQGKTIVWVANNQKILGIIAVADTIRPQAIKTIQHLKKIGIQNMIILSGDRQLTTNYIAQQLGISEVYAELLPEDKVTVIRRLKRQYQTVAMVGDGINDAPALATASVGIAMGTTGSDIALETADIVLMADRLEKLIVAITLGRRAIIVIKQNIVFALCSIGLLLIANFTTGINLPLGVIGHEGSTVLVTLSGLRLLRNTKV
ncbi:heavy metal translocating P-type ATPase [Plectonema cf. radiosum LEGE 06105]|uniref:Heavy metal translocating P-type ATPase n=1 Tax=Plectonema cf. radiosum LEGE 06105 TaxID=945769 RepID=A0A8J7FF59_9CYAN|nr:heavy metal translocating P-type ATPase [Plectonema radiosum]MBE9215363.1 heavy metal translocating P-type ATPase [Plectonema cf. radiosum LEGE 06105]